MIWKVILGNGNEKRGLNMAIWHSKLLKRTFGENKTWLFDGARIAWYV